jgi:hypothetical protein
VRSGIAYIEADKGAAVASGRADSPIHGAVAKPISNADELSIFMMPPFQNCDCVKVGTLMECSALFFLRKAATRALT